MQTCMKCGEEFYTTSMIRLYIMSWRTYIYRCFTCHYHNS